MSALSAAARLATSAEAFTAVKLAGAAYLLYVAWGMARAGLKPAAEAAEVRAPASLWRTARQGFFTNALNPKVALFFLALLPQFIAVDAPDKTLAFLFLGAWFIVQGLLFLLALIALVAPLRRSRPRPWVGRTLHLGGAGLFGAERHLPRPVDVGLVRQVERRLVAHPFEAVQMPRETAHGLVGARAVTHLPRHLEEIVGDDVERRPDRAHALVRARPDARHLDAHQARGARELLSVLGRGAELATERGDAGQLRHERIRPGALCVVDGILPPLERVTAVVGGLRGVARFDDERVQAILYGVAFARDGRQPGAEPHQTVLAAVNQRLGELARRVADGDAQLYALRARDAEQRLELRLRQVDVRRGEAVGRRHCVGLIREPTRGGGPGVVVEREARAGFVQALLLRGQRGDAFDLPHDLVVQGADVRHLLAPRLERVGERCRRLALRRRAGRHAVLRRCHLRQRALDALNGRRERVGARLVRQDRYDEGVFAHCSRSRFVSASALRMASSLSQAAPQADVIASSARTSHTCGVRPVMSANRIAPFDSRMRRSARNTSKAHGPARRTRALGQVPHEGTPVTSA